MKLAEWARANGIHPITAQRWFHTGSLPVRAEKLASGTILVYPNEPAVKHGRIVALYARVSTRAQKDDGLRQLERLRGYAAAHGYAVAKEILEIGSGLNGAREKLIGLLGDVTVQCIVVEHRDRLVRYGFEYLDALMRSQGRSIDVVNSTEHKDDLVQDFVDVVTSMCAKIYGNRGAKDRRLAILQHISPEHATTTEGENVSSTQDPDPPDA